MQYHARALWLRACRHAEIAKTGRTRPPQGRRAASGRYLCRRASRLYRMGMTLGVDVPFFFEGYHEAGAGAGFAEPPAAGFESDPLQRREAIELLDAFRAIGDRVERAKMLELGRLLNSLAKPK